MLYTIKNQHMTVTINDLGAELMSITGADNTEYLWYGDPEFWRSRSPILFPYVGRMTEGSYTLHGTRYSMGLHGFARHAVFTVAEEAESRIVFTLRDSEETRRNYPFSFVLSITYALQDNRLDITYGVENCSQQTMYFGLGGHPGFRLPLEPGKKFEDYRLEFKNSCHPSRVLMSVNYMNSGKEVPFYLENGTTLPLRHALFDNDAIIFDHMDKTATISAGEGSRGVTVHYPQMRYLGLWHTTGNHEAPFVCLEPWMSLPSRDGIVEEFTQQGDLIRLEGGERYRNSWSISIF